MIYGLVIVTTLGATTLLGTFNDRNECVLQAGLIIKGPNAQAQCWPSASVDDLKFSIKEINSTVSNTTVIRK
jgi:hypothetical protein